MRRGVFSRRVFSRRVFSRRVFSRRVFSRRVCADGELGGCVATRWAWGGGVCG